MAGQTLLNSRGRALDAVNQALQTTIYHLANMDERQELARLRAEVDGSAHPSFASLRDYLRQVRDARRL